MLQVLHDQARGVGADGGGPLGHAGTHMHAQAHVYRGSRRGQAGRLAVTTSVARGQVRQQRAGGRARVACMCCGACPGKVGGGGAVHVSLPLAACIQRSASSSPFPTTCRGNTRKARGRTVGAGIQTASGHPGDSRFWLLKT